ncbi:hypothetical protein TCAL_04958 [Tigriopus californicus]|uniref:Copper transporter n=1 Tax=Tigriopus californicus TaxID=6832 RepID=A0A553PDU0_TIGCA|nr:hypothetical protein TCAL_04958 [Tigriopus californicus]|eukprot:TCALIF_04958-PA protein Name:"Protein of unknown function" AED:0.39 eAED:0.39 QI:0/-1/0/1/-1/1/1/0/511
MDQFQTIVKSGHSNGLEELMDNGRQVSAFAITGLDSVDPDYAEGVLTLTTSIQNCFPQSEDIFEGQLPDGSKRSTFATEGSLYPECIQETMNVLSNVFDVVEDAVVEMMAISHGRESLKYRHGATEVELLDAPVKNHLHLYSRPSEFEPKPETNPLVPFHVDNGLFLLLTPFPDHPLQVQLSNGQEVSTQDVDYNSVLVLMGRGITDWLEQGFDSPSLFHPAPHAVPRWEEPIENRGVFARMKVAPLDAVPIITGSLDRVRSFGDVFLESSIHPQGQIERSLASWVQFNEDSCDEGTEYCWMSCLPLPLNPCHGDQNLVCINSLNDTDACFVEGAHDVTCHWTCADEVLDPSNPEPSGAFCRGKTDMLMLGFEVSGRGGFCIILFFDAWTLDTRLKFALGCVGVALMGIAIELLIMVRRRIQKRDAPFQGINKTLKKILLIVGFGVNLIVGYLAMLVVMTYSVELFLSVCLGMIVGHLLFNSSEPIGETIDPCCASQNEIAPPPKEPRSCH